uniref:hypothetical protein n=1 Tax=Stenotrophomonas maltophilia TaxID=40324 RepID=UPI001969AA80
LFTYVGAPDDRRPAVAGWVASPSRAFVIPGKRGEAERRPGTHWSQRIEHGPDLSSHGSP